MPNVNCLSGVRCPRCGQEEHFYIDATVTCHVTDDGAEAQGDTDWHDDSHCSCAECERSGTLMGFTSGAEPPPDPDGKNDDRAAWARKALAAFMEATGADWEDAVCDLLCDLMHWCDRTAADFAAEMERARRHYAAETGSGGNDSAAKAAAVTPFDDYEVHGVAEFGEGHNRYCEQVPDGEAQFWSLYGHIPGEGLECIGDFKTRGHAEEVLARITGGRPGAGE